MTSRAPAWFEKKYIAGAIHALQSEGFLMKGMYREASEIKGNEVVWKIAGKGAATKMESGRSERPIMNAGRTTVAAFMETWEANEWINKIDLEQMSEAEQQIAQQSCAYALGRRFDRNGIISMDNEASLTVQGSGTTAISILDLLEAQASVFAQGLNGKPQLYCAIPFRLMAQLMLFKEWSSLDYGGESEMRKAIGAKTFLGIEVVPFPDEYFTAPAANQVYGYMWMKEALGFASNFALNSRIDYVPTEKGWFAGNDMGGVWKPILPDGMRRLHFATNVALSRQT